MVELDSLFDQLDQEEAALAQEALEESQQTNDAGSTSQPVEKYAKSMLFVRGIPKDATNGELEEYFSNVGPIRSCFVVTEKAAEAPAADADDNKDEDAKDVAASKASAVKNRGFGFVQFVLAEDATRAIEELADVKFRDEKRLMLDFAMKKNMRDDNYAKTGGTSLKRSDAGPKPNDKAKDQKRSAGKKVESRTIIISGIPEGVTKQQLIKKVKKSGTPHSVVYPVPFDGATEEQLKDSAGGSAHVTYDDHSMAQKAVKSLNSHIFKGAKLVVKLKTEYINKNARLIVRNLPFKVRERELEHLFSECGTVLEIKLPRKYTGGPLRGFAFVQMGDYDSAERAIAKWDKYSLHNRAISVALAIAKDRFKELEEKGEVEKPDFEIETDSDSDVNMNSDAGAEDDGDVEGTDQDNSDSDEHDSKDVSMEDSDSESGDEDVVDESLQEGCTLFIRNLSFDSNEDGLFESFRGFGKLRYCRIVYDPETGKSRGTAFVCFWNPADAAKCLAEAEKAQELSNKLTSVPSAVLSDQRNKSILLQEAPKGLDSTSKFMLDGRMLSIAKAVDRNKAHELATEGLKNRKSKDKRNAYLLKEGVVFPDTPAGAMMAPADLEHHIKEYSVRKNQIYKNPNLYMSKTRLTIHNIPRTIDEAGLRNAAISAIGKFKQEVKDKARQPLTKDEMEEGWDKRPRVMQVKVVRSTSRVDANTGKSRSMGYGFIELSTHAHALACLRFLNFRNTKQAFSKQLLDDEDLDDAKDTSAHKISRRSLRVMFAIENAQIVKKRELRSVVIAKRKASRAEAATADGDDEHGNSNPRARSKGTKRSGNAMNGRPAKKGRYSKDRSAISASQKGWDGGKANNRTKRNRK
ncbi:RNA recognition motif-containing protein [Coemansia spiralis]|uniref:RNA recognition motif-containing protein n=2 Tax=Coemansia TaxID=4863 RepID=A0A9W8GAN8_9FUNG|nr:hypothetical protein BX070DRAFT_221676 [Coemansia spiralis]KAJ1996244.1 RNA recognition motif-containing protein [Coemansia umbellata]KAJ2626000.1 RNA recognition motif-containing protein [Coemansia sp. RSA 1358]KAJ2678646.1 RNA recognition motif-containing protein [Coemansia spiralis]